MGKLLHNMDIQLCCFLAGMCVHLFGCQNKSLCSQKLKSSNVFYACARQMMPVVLDRQPSAGASRKVASGHIYVHCSLGPRLCTENCN